MWIEFLAAEQASQPVQELYEKVRGIYGAVLDPIGAFAHSDASLRAYVSFEREIQQARHLPQRISYLVNLRVAKRIDCPFCIDIGLMLALNAGVTETQYAQLDHYHTSSVFTEAERVALEYCDAISSAQVNVGPELQQRLQKHFSTPTIVELTTIIAWEQFRSRFNRALGIEAHGFTASAVA